MHLWEKEGSCTADIFRDASGKIFSECRRTTMSQALQHLAFLKVFVPDACPIKVAMPFITCRFYLNSASSWERAMAASSMARCTSIRSSSVMAAMRAACLSGDSSAMLQAISYRCGGMSFAAAPLLDGIRSLAPAQPVCRQPARHDMPQNGSIIPWHATRLHGNSPAA